MIKVILKNLIIILILTKTIANDDIKFEKSQLKNILFKYFSTENKPDLIGNQFYKNKHGNVVQIDIENITNNINDTIFMCFQTLNKFSKMSKEPINELVVIIHFKNNNLPIVISANNDCLNKFFNSSIVNKLDWKNNCLNIGDL
tara:strand:+ start:1500 stop:1931 length:432 start_codon:yes stop_codon:yes gene_type:complete